MLDFAPQIMRYTDPTRTPYANRVALEYAGLSINEWRQTESRGAFMYPDDRGRGNRLFCILRIGCKTFWFAPMRCGSHRELTR